MHKLHLYYGYGKGKTTSVMGLAVRALGAGQRVAIIQFDKGYDGKNEHYSERKVLRELKEKLNYPIDLIPTGCERMMPDGTFRFKNEAQDFAEAARGVDAAKKILESENVDLLILDEGLAAVAYNLISKETLLELIDLWEAHERVCELVISGHKIWDELAERVDLITEMRKVKHYFDEGTPARLGVEF